MKDLPDRHHTASNPVSKRIVGLLLLFLLYALSLSYFMLFRLNDWLKPLNSK